MAGSNLNPLNEKNLSVIITGASDGIGKAIAIEFAKRKFSLGLIARRSEVLEEVKGACLAMGSPAVHVRAVDVTDEVNFERNLIELDVALNGCNIYIANAGMSGRSSYDETSWSRCKTTLLINVMAAIHGLEVIKARMISRIKYASKELGKNRPRETFILCGVSSFAGVRGMPGAGAYSSSKAALTTHLESLSIDLHSYGISVVTIAPGYIDTPLIKKNKGWMPFIMPAAEAAKIFVDGILKRKAWVVAPKPYGYVYPLLRFMPRWLFAMFTKSMYKKARG